LVKRSFLFSRPGVSFTESLGPQVILDSTRYYDKLIFNVSTRYDDKFIKNISIRYDKHVIGVSTRYDKLFITIVT